MQQARFAGTFVVKQASRLPGSRPQGLVGQVCTGLGAQAPRAWGPAHYDFLKISGQTGEAVHGCLGGGDLEGNEAGIPPLPVLGFHLSARPPKSADFLRKSIYTQTILN